MFCLNIAHSSKLLCKKRLIQTSSFTHRVSASVLYSLCEFVLWNVVATKTYGIGDVRKKLQIAVTQKPFVAT